MDPFPDVSLNINGYRMNDSQMAVVVTSSGPHVLTDQQAIDLLRSALIQMELLETEKRK